MSRTLDVFLIAIVAGLCWWLFFQRDTGRTEVLAADAALAAMEPESRAASALSAQDTAGAPPLPEATPETTQPLPAATGSGSLEWFVDDVALLQHPQLVMLLQRSDESQWRVLNWQLSGKRASSGELQAGSYALGVALSLPTAEVLRWFDSVQVVPGAATAASGVPLPLGELVQQVAFQVEDAAGASVEDYDVRWPGPAWEHPQSTDPYLMAKGPQGKVLLPRRSNVRVTVIAGGAQVQVGDPIDGQSVQLPN